MSDIRIISEVKTVIDDRGNLFAKFPNGIVKEIYVNTYNNPYYGFLTVNLEKEEKDGGSADEKQRAC